MNLNIILWNKIVTLQTVKKNESYSCLVIAIEYRDIVQ